jgi:hypothetical protein
MLTNAKEAQRILQDIDYLDYSFEVKYDGDRMYLQAAYIEPDIHTKLPEKQTTRKWFLSPYMTKSEFVQTVLKCALTSAEHRVREHFLYKNERVFGPHFDVDDLVVLCKANRTDERKSVTK